MTSRSYLDSFLLPFRVGSGPEVEQDNSRAKHLRQSHKRKFTEPGEPGEMFRCNPTLDSCFNKISTNYSCATGGWSLRPVS